MTWPLTISPRETELAIAAGVPGFLATAALYLSRQLKSGQLILSP
jgi:hypothetical protein